MEPATEAAHSAAKEPNADVTPYKTCAAGHLDSSPATGSEPPASVPIESDWAPIMEFSSADIFSTRPGRRAKFIKVSLLVRRPLAEVYPA